MESSLATAIPCFLSSFRWRPQIISGVERISLIGLMVSNFWGIFKGSIKSSLWISPPNCVTYKMGWAVGLLTKSPEPPICRPNSHLAKATNSPWYPGESLTCLVKFRHWYVRITRSVKVTISSFKPSPLTSMEWRTFTLYLLIEPAGSSFLRGSKFVLYWKSCYIGSHFTS